MHKRSRNAQRPVQLTLPLLCAAKQPVKARGRKLGEGRRRVRHREREAHFPAHPVHVVLRSRLRSLRSQFMFATIRLALARATRSRADFRVTQFSVQADHLHLIVEAGSKQSLARGMQGLAIRIARRLNALLSRSGKVWADRFYSRALKSPRVVRNALAYVLNNFRKHRAPGAARIDPYSSAPYFTGFSGLHGRAPCDLHPSRGYPMTPHGVPPPAEPEHVPVVLAQTWLGKVGWRRSPAIPFHDLGRVA